MARRVRFQHKDLKEPDQFISTTDVVVAYFSQHRKILFAVVAGFVVTVLAVVGIRYNSQVEALRMESLYFEMEEVRDAKRIGPEEVTVKMENLLSEFNEGPQKQRAVLLLADTFYRTRKYDRSIPLYKDVMETGRADRLPSQLASVGMAYSLEGKKDYKQAIAAYKTIIEGQSGYPLFHVYLSLSRCYELNNERNSALLTLREMKTRFFAHSRLNLVDIQLKKLEAQA